MYIKNKLYMYIKKKLMHIIYTYTQKCTLTYGYIYLTKLTFQTKYGTSWFDPKTFEFVQDKRSISLIL